MCTSKRTTHYNDHDEEEDEEEDEDDECVEYLFSVLVVGEKGTGKTSIVKRYVHDIFSKYYRSTIGVDFALKVIEWDPKTQVRLQMWDISGQERFGNMTRVYYKEVMGAIIVFDATRLSTFEAVVEWKNDIDSKVTTGPDERPIPIVLLANKHDLTTTTDPQVHPLDMKKFVEANGFLECFNTSAKDNFNIDRAMKCLVNHLLEDHGRCGSCHRRFKAQAALELERTEKLATTGGCCK